MARLQGKRVAILVTDGFEQVEMTGPKEALEQAGASAEILSAKSGTVRGWNHTTPADEFKVDHSFDRVRAEDYDAWCCPAAWSTPTISAWTRWPRRWCATRRAPANPSP